MTFGTVESMICDGCGKFEEYPTYGANGAEPESPSPKPKGWADVRIDTPPSNRTYLYLCPDCYGKVTHPLRQVRTQHNQSPKIAEIGEV